MKNANSMSLMLRQRWNQLASRYCEDSISNDNCFDHIEKFYSEPHRAYHTLNHINSMFVDIDMAKIDNDSVGFSAWFHDIIYQPGASDNELQSASYARKIMTAMEIDKAIIEKVEYMINCTQTHSNPLADYHTQLFLDVDMAILGANQTDYKDYIDQIRTEFKQIPTKAFNKGRFSFINGVLKQSKIYLSDDFHSRYEEQARINLQWEIDSFIK